MTYESRLDRAMSKSNVVRYLVEFAIDLELSRPPTLTNAEALGDPDIDQAWSRVDEALERGGF